MNPRWVHWLRAHPERMEEQHGFDFVIWIGQRWNEWCELTGRPRHALTEQDHIAFDEWLATWEAP